MASTVFKQKLYAHCLAVVGEKLSALEAHIHALRQDLQSESKSTAGDKHETGRAMLQLEMEKLGTQHQTLEKSMQLLQRTNISRESEQLQSGSLARINQTWYFVCIGLGSVELEGHTVFCLAPGAPLAQALLRKKVGDTVQFRGTEMTLEQLL